MDKEGELFHCTARSVSSIPFHRVYCASTGGPTCLDATRPSTNRLTDGLTVPWAPVKLLSPIGRFWIPIIIDDDPAIVSAQSAAPHRSSLAKFIRTID